MKAAILGKHSFESSQSRSKSGLNSTNQHASHQNLLSQKCSINYCELKYVKVGKPSEVSIELT